MFKTIPAFTSLYPAISKNHCSRCGLPLVQFKTSAIHSDKVSFTSSLGDKTEKTLTREDVDRKTEMLAKKMIDLCYISINTPTLREMQKLVDECSGHLPIKVFDKSQFSDKEYAKSVAAFAINEYIDGKMQVKIYVNRRSGKGALVEQLPHEFAHALQSFIPETMELFQETQDKTDISVYKNVTQCIKSKLLSVIPKTLEALKPEEIKELLSLSGDRDKYPYGLLNLYFKDMSVLEDQINMLLDFAGKKNRKFLLKNLILGAVDESQAYRLGLDAVIKVSITDRPDLTNKFLAARNLYVQIHKDFAEFYRSLLEKEN